MAFHKFPNIISGLIIFSDPQNQSARHFLSALESLTPNYDDIQRLAVLRNHISGSVRTLVLSTDLREITVWNDFKTAFLSTFSCKVDTATLLREFYQFRRRSTESWFDTFARLLHIAQQIKMEDPNFDVDKQCFHLLSGLVHPAILDSISYQTGSTFQSYFPHIMTFINRHPELVSHDKLATSLASSVKADTSLSAATSNHDVANSSRQHANACGSRVTQTNNFRKQFANYRKPFQASFSPQSERNYSSYNRTRSFGKHYNSSFYQFPCKRCDSEDHNGYECNHWRTICSYCSLKGHVSLACYRRKRDEAQNRNPFRSSSNSNSKQVHSNQSRTATSAVVDTPTNPFLSHMQ
ncbi:hypothetical protein SNEBB_010067 [Seison nebaliae]|nr:hypothetical protein SNEBB_010067 [Seison nebaliae]